MAVRELNYARRNRALPGGCASFLARFSRGACGRLWSAHSETPCTFRGLEQLLAEMETEMNRIGCPAPTFPKRETHPAPAQTVQNQTGWRSGTAPRAVSVRVLRRQNGDIQGLVQICGTGRQAGFRSGEELLLLLRSELEAVQNAEKRSTMPQGGRI